MTAHADQPNDPGQLRASDDDRNAVARILQTASDEGRITPVELQERLDTLYRTKTLRELEPLTWDLPGHRELAPRPAATPVSLNKPTAGSTTERIGGTPTSSVAIGIMSGATRAGAWVVPAQFSAVAVMGGVDIDLTKARFAERQVTITALAIMGGIDIVVPEDVTVVVNGVGLMGSFEDNARTPGTVDGPVVRINGLALMGGVDVHLPKGTRTERNG
ncbi:DUF1707 SHOCT-like domain-containing protein [Nakamurella multipartita]|uniref:Uncharacterized protein n=1 Tax=Nakamurella multipartita (strain ATCC 700099 / DSM 44233 / CIP 104796 / JCM 9543 / NBRC 105858 / Y-104) TaxID=479431 RepID=C8XHB7_NAKMY|nr:DUF1707 domain-containing protein [Nakamurella multipartita]ACV78323.1 protein of unknown function DUF1707 [Nakamurella multipartita DSM 44233]